MEDLSAAPPPATFGLKQQDVTDLSHRKAGKLDVGNFFWGFNLDSRELGEKIVSGPFSWRWLYRTEYPKHL